MTSSSAVGSPAVAAAVAARCDRRQAAAASSDLVAAAVVEGDVQRHPRVGRVGGLGRLDARQQVVRHARPPARRSARARPRSCTSGTCDSIISTNSCMRAATSSGGRRQFSRAERVARVTSSMPQVEGVLDDAAQRLGACPVAGGHGQAPALRPAPVAVHDDGHVAALGAAGRRLARRRPCRAARSAPAVAERPCDATRRGHAGRARLRPRGSRPLCASAARRSRARARR